MNFDNYRSHQTPPPKSGCRRQNAWLNAKTGETQLKGQSRKSAKDASRRRAELRRIRSLSQEKSAADPSCSSRNEIRLSEKREESDQNETTEGKSEGSASEDDAADGGACRSYGKISVVGRRREMADVVEAELGFLKRGEESYDFFGVYQGHGGWRVARACGQMLHKILAKIAEEESGEEIDWKEVMAAGFSVMDPKVNRNGVAAMESTAVVAVVGENEVAVANGRGPRVVLSRGGVAVELVDDHKVIRHVIIRRSDDDEFLILGSDGLWDAISNELACRVARRYLVEEVVK